MVKKQPCVDRIMPIGDANESSEVNARPSIRSKPHHLPLILESLETEPPCELGIKQANRIRPPNHIDESELGAFAMPDRGCLPGTSPVDHHHRRLVEPRNRICAQGMGIMVVDSLEAIFRRPDMSAEEALAIPLVLLNSTDGLSPQSSPPSHRMRARKKVTQI